VQVHFLSMAIVPCPKTWELPLAPGYFPEEEEIHHQVQVCFFSRLLPGISIRQIKPIYGKERPCCSWEIICYFEGPVNNGFANHIYQIVQNNKYTNVTIGDINFHSYRYFSVIYNVNCDCNPVDF
jgi:hypothetical protein